MRLKKTNKKKTRKLKNYFFKAICVLHKNTNGVEGYISFTQKNKKSKVKIEYNIKGLKDGDHGFHVHEYGDLTDGCTSSCSHFNPFNKNHGGINSKERHAGDLGNIKSKNKLSHGTKQAKDISLDLKSKCCIIGRCIVIHEDPDDNGLGGDEESLKTGNAGKRLACGVIGLAKKC